VEDRVLVNSITPLYFGNHWWRGSRIVLLPLETSLDPLGVASHWWRSFWAAYILLVPAWDVPFRPAHDYKQVSGRKIDESLDETHITASLNLVLSAGTPIVLAETTAPVLASAAPTAPAEVTQPAPSRETTGKPENIYA